MVTGARPGSVAIAAVGLLTAAAAAENSDVAGSLKVLSHPRWTWLAAGVALEVISMAAFAAMFRQLLTAGRARPRRSEMLVTVYAANAMSVSVPLAGPSLAAAYLFRRFTRFGAGAASAGWTLLAGAVISAAAWVVVLAVGGLASGRTVALAVTVPALALVVAATAALAAAARYPRVRQYLENLLSRALARAAQLLRWPATDPKLALRAWGQRFGALRLPTSSWGLALGDSLVNWFADAAVLTVAIIAVGGRVPWRDPLLVYGAGVAAQGLSLTPGGLGITEGAISLALVGSGVHVRQAVAAAVLYRLTSFWLNAAVGWLILLLLQARRPTAQSAPEPALEPSAEPVPVAAPRAHELVLLHGQPRQRRRLGLRPGPAAGPPARGGGGPSRLRRERAPGGGLRRQRPGARGRPGFPRRRGGGPGRAFLAGGAALLAAREARTGSRRWCCSPASGRGPSASSTGCWPRQSSARWPRSLCGGGRRGSPGSGSPGCAGGKADRSTPASISACRSGGRPSPARSLGGGPS